ncbi:DUF5072 family protein [Eubacterium aggregans]|uniref:DUF5072 family protein n=1 Tax=Eubacterium aggregans TaxID=81409 RepID=UPI003F2A9C56
MDLHAAIKGQVEEATKIRCYDTVPLNAPTPFYYVEVVSVSPDNSKTMFRDRISVLFHAITDGMNSVGVYGLIQKLEECMTEDIVLPAPFELIGQDSTGLQTIKDDETGELHAVLGFDYLVCYGFKTKI